MSMLRVSARLCAHRNSPDNFELPLRGKLINPRPIIFDGIELRVVNIVSVQLPITGK
jgi:hypothetical protein